MEARMVLGLKSAWNGGGQTVQWDYIHFNLKDYHILRSKI